MSGHSMTRKKSDAPALAPVASGDPLAPRDATIAEYRYQLDRINASPLWRFGMALANLPRGRRDASH
jgi:hypothetical protein